MRGLRSAIFACVLAAAAAPAMAGTVTATLSSVTPAVTNLSVSFNGGGFENCYIGKLNWTNNTGDQTPGNSFSTFCIDGVQNVYLGSPATWTIGGLADSPHPISNSPFGMGTERAARLTDFWDRHYASLISPVQSGVYTPEEQEAAFQIDIWEIVYDSPTNTGNMNFTADLFNGNFKLQNSAATDLSVILAENWLGDLTSPGSFTQYQLSALQSDTYQDQVFGLPPVSQSPSPVPLPAALPMGLTLLSGLGVVAKFRRRGR